MKQQVKSDLLRQWRSGTISAENKRKLELEALNDDFLFEAMEGYANHTSEVHTRDISEKLLTRVSRHSAPRTIKMWMPRIAVAASLVLLMGLLWWNFSLDNKEYAAVEKKEVSAKESISMESPSRDEKNERTYAGLAKKEAVNMVAVEEEEVRTEELISESEVKVKKSVVDDFLAQKPTISATKVDEPVAQELEGLDEGSMVEELPVGDLNYEDAISSVEIEKITPPAVVVVKSSRDKAKKRSSSSKDIEWKEMPSERNEEDLDAYDLSNIRYEIAPEKGWEAFDKYIENERIKSASALRANIKAKVVVEFELDEKGYPINIRVVESNWSSLNENAVLLIQFGGKWNTNDRTKSVRYIVEYP